MTTAESPIHELQTISSTLLGAAARGEVDLNALAKAILADRGQDANGRWVGFKEAARIHQPVI